MARNTQVAADHNAPPITQILANFVATHPSRGWSDTVDHEAHRTFMNWLGCAVGAAHHEAADAALAAVKLLQPSPQATVLRAPDLREKLAVEAIEPLVMSPEQFAAFIQTDIARWTKLAKERKIELDS